MENITELFNATTRASEALPSGTLITTMHQLTYYEAFFISLLLLLCAVFIHEVSHLLVMKRKVGDKTVFAYIVPSKFFVSLQTGIEEQYQELSPSDKIDIYLAGILGGCAVILFGALVHPFYSLVFAPYLVGCSGDFVKIWNNVQKIGWKEVFANAKRKQTE